MKRKIKRKLWMQTYLLLIGSLLMFTNLSAQSGSVLNIRGTITDQSGQTVIGASVQVKGTTNGTLTDLDGNYQISAPSDATLVFSFIGYHPQEIRVAGKTTINVILSEDAKMLEDIVVIGYGSVRKEDLTGSITAIKVDEMNKGAVTSPQQLIQGKIPGVFVAPGSGQPGAGSTMRIRSGASLNASNDPLIVIDGVPVSNDAAPGMANGLASINPNDIETFTVLKDASATAIFGSRASNGVIMITTKKGGKTLKVSYNSTYSLSDPYNKIETLNASQYRQKMNELYPESSIYHKPAMELLNMYPEQSTNWQDLIFRTAFATDQNVSVSGTSLNTPFRVSVGYNNEEGTLKESNFRRLTSDISINPKFFDNHLSVNLNIKGTINYNDFVDSGAVGSAAFYDPTKPTHNEDGRYNGYWNWTTNGTANGQGPTNPLSLIYDNNDQGTTRRSLGNIQFDYKMHFLPEMRANLNLGYDVARGKGYNKGAKPYSFQAEKNNDFPMLGLTSDWNNFRRTQLMEFYLNYEKEFKKIKSRVNAMGGYSWQWFYMSNYEFTHSPAGMEPTKTPDNNWIFNESENFFVKKGSYRLPSEHYLISFFGRLNYVFMDRYLLTATVRRDGSSRFSKDNRWGTFPSVALAWTLTNEPFLKDQQILSTLKLRIGYGQTGQQEIGTSYEYIPNYVSNTNPNSTYLDNGLIKPNRYNSDLKWETTDTYNAGFDFGFLNNRINGSIDVYKKKTKDLLVESDVAAGTNFANRMYMNIGNMQNKGVEFSVNAMALQIKDFSWEVGFNATWNESKITKLIANSDPNYTGIPVSGISAGLGSTIARYRVGYTPYAFYTYQQVYDANGKPIQNALVDRNGDGQITEADRYMNHSPMPKWFFGFNSQFRYKQFDLGFNLRANIGNYVFNDVLASNSTAYNAYSSRGFLNNLYKGVNKTGFVMANDMAQNQSDLYLENASFLKMDNLTFGYSFSDLLSSKLSGRVSFSVQNVFTITDYSGLDPEVPGVEGVDRNIWPRPRVFTLGLNLNF